MERPPPRTGVIEGTCHHLVKDRMDRPGARWGLDGAEQERVHLVRYAPADILPGAVMSLEESRTRLI